MIFENMAFPSCPPIDEITFEQSLLFDVADYKAKSKMPRYPELKNATNMKLSQSLPPKQPLHIPQCQLHPSWPAMVALAAMRGDFHFAEQGVHFGDRQHAAGADGAVAGHGGGDMVDAFLER